MRVKAVVAYDGTDYHGFQWQKNAPTIQGALESALAQLTQQPTRIVVAGRTDAGVHASGQVIAFDVDWRHELSALQRAMNALLPKQIAIQRLDKAPAAFHPRYDARRRWYRYTIYRAEVREPIVARHSWHVWRKLDVQAMHQAAQSLVGQHDFSAFGSPPQGNNAVREIYHAAWMEQGVWLTFDVEANAFLYRMVRMLVGTLVRVGDGSLDPETFADILHTQDRRRAGPAAPPQGLNLCGVFYANDQDVRSK